MEVIINSERNLEKRKVSDCFLEMLQRKGRIFLSLADRRFFNHLLGAAAIHVDDIGRNAEITEWTIRLCLKEDHGEETWTEDSTVIEETVLNSIDGLVCQVLNFILLRTTVEVDQGLLVVIEAMAKVGLETLHLSGVGHGSNFELDRWLLNFTYEGQRHPEKQRRSTYQYRASP